MAFPPRFGVSPIPQTTFVPVYGTPMISMVQTASYLMPTIPGGVITSMNPRGGGGMRPRRPLLPHEQQQQNKAQGVSPTDKAPPTTVFVGNITEKASNELIKTMLARCGTILNWKRVQGPTGRFQAFGFCEYDHPDSTLRAVRLLHEWRLGDKPLTVKVDEKTKDLLREYVNKRRQAQGKPALKFEGDQLPCDEDMAKEDEAFRKSLINAVKELGPDLMEGNEGMVPRAKTPELYGKGGNLDIGSLDRERKEYIAREISSFRQAYMDDNKDKKDKDRQDRHRHHRDRRDEKSNSRPEANRKRPSPSPPPMVQQQPPIPMGRPESRSSTATGGRVRSLSPQGSTNETQNAAPMGNSGGWNRGRRRDSSPEVSKGGRGRRSSRSRSRPVDSDDDEIERRRLDRKIREKEASYLERLRNWESREKKRTREYERERLKQKLMRREELREAKKLKEFLEDYDDERDDLKYYKGKSYEMRRRDYEKERESDNRDRQREKEEFEEIKKKLLEEGVEDPEEEIAKIQKEQDEKLSKRMTAGDSSESPSPVHRSAQRTGADDSGSEEEDAASSAGRRDDEEEGERRSRSHEDGRHRKRRASDADRHDEAAKKSRFVPAASDAPSSKSFGFTGLKLASAAPSSATGVPAQDDVGEEEERKTSSRRLVPLEYTEEEKMAVSSKKQASGEKTGPTPEEKKKLIKNVIEKIPTVKEELFAYPISWNQVDSALIDRRLKPWITKKIVEYIGEDEQSLVEFICQKISQKTPPQTIIDDISMVLDEEAGVFVVKLWRLLIYEIEAKKLGLVKSDGAS